MPPQRFLTPEEQSSLLSDLNDAFSPGAPVQERDLFAGRIPQLRGLLDAVEQRGRHAIVYGERGVGKTSIANILGLMTGNSRKNVVFVKVNADPSDTFTSIWKKVFRRLSVTVSTEAGPRTTSIVDNYPGDITPDDIQIELSSFPLTTRLIIVIDEFDTILDRSVTKEMAIAIKTLSDYSNEATVILVGIADDVSKLIEDHNSIARSLLQVNMPRMSQDELASIIRDRYNKCGIKVDEEALWKMTFLARGLPYYAQLSGLHAARHAIRSRRREVVTSDIDKGLASAIADLEQSIKMSYLVAVRSQRDDTLYAPVLLACALAQGDEMGAFQQTAVAEPLNRIVQGGGYKSTTFAFHMNALCEDARGKVLERFGEPRNYRYRFKDPLMQPFVIIKGLAEKMITDETAGVYANRRQLSLSNDW